jgi:hypothetical protein
LSSILDALRKAQAKRGENESATDAQAEVPAEVEVDDELAAFDDVAPADRGLASGARRPNTIAAAGVALLGLGLGIAGARFFADRAWEGGDEEIVAATDEPQVDLSEGVESKKSAALDEQAVVVARSRREARARSKSAKSTKEPREGELEEAAAEPPPDDMAAPPLQEQPPEAPALAAPLAPDALPPDSEAAPLAPPTEAPAAAVSPAVASGALPPLQGTEPVAPPAAVPPSPTAPPPPAPGAPPAEANSGVQTAAAVPPAAAPGAPGEPAGAVLDTPPTDAPEVSLLFIRWSRVTAGRVASLRGPGGKLMLVHEGDIIEGMRVSAIRPDAVELQWRGTNFLLLAAR